MSARFKSPLRDEFLPHHNIERLVEETIEIFNEIPRADVKGGRGIEGVGVIVVDHTNDPRDTTSLIKRPPAPREQDPASYYRFLGAIKDALEKRFFT